MGKTGRGSILHCSHRPLAGKVANAFFSDTVDANISRHKEQQTKLVSHVGLQKGMSSWYSTSLISHFLDMPFSEVLRGNLKQPLRIHCRVDVHVHLASMDQFSKEDVRRFSSKQDRCWVNGTLLPGIK